MGPWCFHSGSWCLHGAAVGPSCFYSGSWLHVVGSRCLRSVPINGALLTCFCGEPLVVSSGWPGGFQGTSVLGPYWVRGFVVGSSWVHDVSVVGPWCVHGPSMVGLCWVQIING